MDVKLSDFLSAFYPGLDEPIHLRAIRPKGAAKTSDNQTVKIKTTRRKLANDTRLQDYLRSLNQTRGLYFVVNSGGNLKADITRFNAFFAEGDDLPIPEQHTSLDKLPLQTSARLETLKSVHAYLFITGDCSAAEWQEIQRRLASYLHSDTSLDDLPQLMRLPHFNHVSLNSEGGLNYKPVEIIQFELERRYTVQQLLDAFPPLQSKPSNQAKPDRQNNSGYATWDALWAEWGRRLMAHSSARLNSAGNWDCRGICHDGKGDSGLVYFPYRNRGHCNADCDEPTILRAFELPERPNGDAAKPNGKAAPLDEVETVMAFDQRAQAIISAEDATRNDLTRKLVSDLVSFADALTIEQIGKLFKDAKIFSLTVWRQLIKDERERHRERRLLTAQEQDRATRAARVQELIEIECDLATIHQKLSETTSSPHSHDIIELAIATSISHRLANEKLVWLLIVGPPSSDKTQTALAIKDAPHVFHLDTLTENAFISGFVSPDGRSPQDLLAELDGRCLTIKDLNALFSQHPDKVAKVLGDLTAIYDEEFAKWTGTRGDVRYKARFSLIGCVTPFALAQHHRYMSMIGARFLSYRVAELNADAVDEGFDTIWESKEETKVQLRQLASAYATRLHHQLTQGTVDLPTFSKSAKSRLNSLAKFLAHARAAVRTQRADIQTDSGKTATVYEIVEVQREEPFRALCQLRALATALAIVHQRSAVTEHELELCRRVVLSSMPHDRSLVLALYQDATHLTQISGLTRTAAAEGIGKARNQAVRLLTELEAIGVLSGEKLRDEEQSVDVWTYFPASDDFADILTKEILPLDHSGDLNNSLSPGEVLCHPHLTQNFDRDAEKKEGFDGPEISGEITSAIPEISCESIQRGPAIWRNQDSDQPVDVTGDLGIGADGRRYASVADSMTAIPTDELVYPKEEWGEV